MKKSKKVLIIISALFICFVSVYFIYGSTLVNINSEKSISNHLAADKNKTITIIDTAELGDYFGILYTDPVDEEQGYIHFRYITKASIYKNRCHNTGGDSRTTTEDTTFFELNNIDKNRHSSEVFIFGKGRDYDNELSIFEYNEETQKYKRIEKIEVPKQPFLMAKTYSLEESHNSIRIQDEFSYIDDLIK